MTHACFFVRLRDRSALDRVEFYAQDIRALRQLGYEVTIATRWSEIPWRADVYFIWWWTWAFLPLLKAAASGRPAVITGVFNYRFSESAPSEYSNRRGYERLLMRSALRQASANIFLSHVELGAVTSDLRATRPCCIPLGVDTDRYRPGISERRTNLVFTLAWLYGPNADRKCVRNIIDAIPLVLARRPDARFVIAGAQSEGFDELQNRARRLGVENAIEWTGKITEDRKIELLQTCAVYLSPSVFEGFGLAILEAMACAAPIVSSPVGAVPEVLGEAGKFVHGRSADQISEAVLCLLEDPAEGVRLGQQARQRAVSLFTLDRRIRGLEEVLSVVGSPQTRDSGPTRPRSR